jgi:hypothetical protein
MQSGTVLCVLGAWSRSILPPMQDAGALEGFVVANDCFGIYAYKGRQMASLHCIVWCLAWCLFTAGWLEASRIAGKVQGVQCRHIAVSLSAAPFPHADQPQALLQEATLAR